MPWGQIFISCIRDNHNSWKTTVIVSPPFINHLLFLFLDCPFSFAQICVFQIAIPKTPDKALCSLQSLLTLCKKHFSYYCYHLEKKTNKQTKPLRENITKNLCYWKNKIDIHWATNLFHPLNSTQMFYLSNNLSSIFPLLSHITIDSALSLIASDCDSQHNYWTYNS